MMARRWFEEGAERLHLVDLDGAVSGRPINGAVIKKIVDGVPIPVELGGGIRDMDVLEYYLEIGVHSVILGTVAHKDPQFVARACERHPGRIILGIDGKNGRVSVEGWTEETLLSPVDLAKQFEDVGVSAIIYTDIMRDGMRSGPNVEGTRDLAKAIDIPVIASGGISDVSDVSKIAALSDVGVVGMITGRALYDGSLRLPEAIETAGGGGGSRAA
jgi:phosphoribosylformimino-5-aminoimidazole carboxamide ribotide isomerase